MASVRKKNSQVDGYDPEAEINAAVDGATVDDSAKRCPVAVLEWRSFHADDLAAADCLFVRPTERRLRRDGVPLRSGRRHRRVICEPSEIAKTQPEMTVSFSS